MVWPGPGLGPHGQMSLGASGPMSLVSLVRLVTRMWRMFRMSELGPWSLLTCRAGCGAAASETELLSRRPLASVRGCLGQCTHSDWAAQAAQARVRIKSIPADPSQARTQDTHRPVQGQARAAACHWTLLTCTIELSSWVHPHWGHPYQLSSCCLHKLSTHNTISNGSLSASNSVQHSDLWK